MLLASCCRLLPPPSTSSSLHIIPLGNSDQYEGVLHSRFRYHVRKHHVTGKTCFCKKKNIESLVSSIVDRRKDAILGKNTGATTIDHDTPNVMPVQFLHYSQSIGMHTWMFSLLAEIIDSINLTELASALHYSAIVRGGE